MRAYIIRRLLLLIPTLLLVTMLIFAAVRFIPGDVVDLMIAEAGPQETARPGGIANVEALRHRLGLDVPLPVQYGRWIGAWPQESGEFSGVLQGDLGTSLWTSRPVTEDIGQRLPITFEIGIIAMIVALIIALPIGIYSAIRQDTVGDYLGRSFAIACIALPSFWLATMVMVFPSVWWNWSPAVQLIPFTEDPLGNLGQFIIPGIILGMVLSGTTTRLTRTMMLEVLRQDYIRTAWSKGLRERTVIMRHALKNALIPVVTIVGVNLPILIGGAVVIEQIFALPGLGILLIEALNKRDYIIVSGVNLVVAIFVLLINLGIDLTYAYLDPRVRYK